MRASRAAEQGSCGVQTNFLIPEVSAVSTRLEIDLPSILVVNDGGVNHKRMVALVEFTRRV